MLALCLMAVAPSSCVRSFSLPSQNAELMLDIITEQPCLHWQGARAGFAVAPCPIPLQLLWYSKISQYQSLEYNLSICCQSDRTGEFAVEVCLDSQQSSSCGMARHHFVWIGGAPSLSSCKVGLMFHSILIQQPLLEHEHIVLPRVFLAPSRALTWYRVEYCFPLILICVCCHSYLTATSPHLLG